MSTTERTRFYHVLFDRAWKRPRRTSISSAGVTVELRGWDVGVEVHAIPNLEDPSLDEFRVFVTRGTNGHAIPGQLIATVYTGEDDEGPLIVRS